MNTETEKTTVGASNSSDLLGRIIDELCAEWQVGSLVVGTICGDFAAEVAKRAVAAEREACAIVCEQQASEPECPERAQYCADAIRLRT